MGEQEDIIITIADFRVVGICPRSRHWFAKHGLDWKSFVKNGIPLSELRATNDHQANVDRLEAKARERLNG